jgi:cell division protein FtsZ
MFPPAQQQSPQQPRPVASQPTAQQVPQQGPQHGNGQQPAPQHNNGQGAPAPAGQPAQHQQQQEPAARPPRTVTFDDADDLDVPDFLK